VYLSTLGWSVIKKKKKKDQAACLAPLAADSPERVLY